MNLKLYSQNCKYIFKKESRGPCSNLRFCRLKNWSVNHLSWALIISFFVLKVTDISALSGKDNVVKQNSIFKDKQRQAMSKIFESYKLVNMYHLLGLSHLP